MRPARTILIMQLSNSRGKETAAHQHHIPGLGIGKNAVPGKICIRVLKAARYRQHRPVAERLRHLIAGQPV